MKYIVEIESYLRNEMSRAERQTFEKLVEKNEELAQELAEYEDLFSQFQHARNAAYVKKQISIIQDQEDRNTLNISHNMRKSLKKYWRTAGIAASVAFLASVATYFIAENTFNKENDTRILQLVNKEVRDIKNKQTRLQNDINKVKINTLPNQPHQGSGTAFAVDNKGYALTNLHVLKGGKKVFIFTADGKAHKCKVVKKDEQNDLAVLKVLDSSFAFSTKSIPYQLDSKAHLAERIFTLGFPKNEVVYNEGYVSAMNGKGGDSTKFQLELPSSPGVSGAPVLDASGNLIGIVNSKQFISKGITYAIKTTVINNLLDSLKAPFEIKSLESNSFPSQNRTKQIESLEDFILMVKVYN